MSALHRIEITKVENALANVKIFAVHPDAQRFPSSKDYLLQFIISYWDDLRAGYDFNFSNLGFSKNEMKQTAENFARRDDFEKWLVLMRGEERAITEAQFDALSLKEIRHDPPQEDLARVEKNKRELGREFGGEIVRVFKKRNNFAAPMIYGIGLSPDTDRFIEIADQIIVALTIGKSREYKNFSESTRSYGFQEITFQISEANYLRHLRQGSSFEVANVAFSRS